MLKDFLKEVISLVVGKQSEEIADLLNNKKHVNEFIIAKKLNLTINQTRNILYRIANHGLVSSIRKKDKRKGWYTYFWKIEILKSLEFLKLNTLRRMEQLNNQVKSRETKQFYVCEKCNVEFSEENALLYDFTCGECGNIFTLKDNTKVLRELKKNLLKFKKKLEDIDEEIKKEEEKIDKIRIKELKKQKEEKDKKRKETRKKAAKTKEANKKLKKKPIKKKPLKKKVVKKKPIKKKSKSKPKKRK